MSQKDSEIKAQVFDRLINHLQDRTEVQNIDLMILADFCRNCLSRWYEEAANEQGLQISNEEARELVYGMPYSEWKEKFQLPATAEQLAAMSAKKESK